MASQEGLAWPAAELKKAWKVLVFNQFHDILPGSAIHDSNRDSRALYAEGLRLANQVKQKSLRYLSARVGIAKGEGIPIVVYNPLAWERSEVCVAELVLNERFSGLSLFDALGAELPVQLLRSRDFGSDYHIWVQFVPENVPGIGYAVYRLKLHGTEPYRGRNGQPPKDMGAWWDYEPELTALPVSKSSALSRHDWSIRNPYFEAEFSPKDGSLKSLRLRKGETFGPNLVGKEGANKLGIYMEKPHPMSAWTLDSSAQGPKPVQVLKPLAVVQEGPQSITLRAELGYSRSKFKLYTTIHAESPRIDCRLKADWLEKGGEAEDGPMLRALWHLAKAPGKFFGDVAYGVLERPEGREQPCQKWADAGGLAVLNLGKYGHSLEKDCLRLTLLRSSYDPDQYPDLGRHEIRWALLPHAGNHFQAGLPKLGMSYNVPLEAYQAREQEGPLGLNYAFLVAEADPSFVVTGLKQAESGEGSVIRGYDAEGKAGELKLKFGAPVQAASETNLLEEPISGGQGSVIGGEAVLKIRPYGIATLWMK
jgi:alpha-mannosidase